MYPGAVVAYSACLAGEGGACTFATGGQPAVLHRGALSEEEMLLIAKPQGHRGTRPGARLGQAPHSA